MLIDSCSASDQDIVFAWQIDQIYGALKGFFLVRTLGYPSQIVCPFELSRVRDRKHVDRDAKGHQLILILRLGSYR